MAKYAIVLVGVVGYAGLLLAGQVDSIISPTLAELSEHVAHALGLGHL